jgi:purine nucleosidase
VRRLLIDTDLAMGAPGSDIDDGFALAFALGHQELSVELVTTVHGNTDVDTATRLSSELLRRLGRADVPVVRGSAHPLLGTGAAAARASVVERRRRAASEIVERVLAEPGALTVVAIGPLTNLALALLLEPGVAAAVREIVIMGGSYLEHTNIAAMPGEFNIWADPDAAAVVFGSGAALRCVGLDVTRRVRLTRAHAAAMAAGGRPFGEFAGECTLGWIDHHERAHPGDPREQGSCAMHDPLAVAAVVLPEMLTWRSAHVAVETVGTVARGVTVADLLTTAHPPVANCEIATDVDADRFSDVFLAALRRL